MDSLALVVSQEFPDSLEYPGFLALERLDSLAIQARAYRASQVFLASQGYRDTQVLELISRYQTKGLS